MKNIYRKNGDPDIMLHDLHNLKDLLVCITKGSEIKWIDEKKKYKCISRDDRYIIVAKQYNLQKCRCQYSIIDTQNMCCNKDNMLFGCYNYLEEGDCAKALQRLNDSGDPFEISLRGLANIEDIIDEIWCECDGK